MKKVIILIGICLFFGNIISQENKKNEIIQKKSALIDFNTNYPGTSFPRPFVTNGNPVENPKNSPAASTGYYLVHSNDPAALPWRPVPTIVDTTEDSKNWRRIFTGPNQKSNDYWLSHHEDGFRYFRNPKNMSDSCDNAIAGPIPIGFKFLFNGIEYDSFYVSTNGAIFLSNSRYNYDSVGNREFRSNNYGNPNCYNSMSMDWFERANRSGTGLADTTKDNWGWQKAIKYGCDSNYAKNARPDNNGGGMDIPLIAPFWGDGAMTQWNSDDMELEDRGRVYFYKDTNGYKLIVYFVDWQLKGNINTPSGSPTAVVTAPEGLRPWDNYFVSANAQITLNKSDSSVTITYERFRGRVSAWNIWEAKEVIRFNTSSAISGPARHQNYNSKNNSITLPWAEEYDQSTYAWSKYITSQHTGYPDNTQAIKFKQWKNTLRVCDISFRVRQQKENSPDFTQEVLTSKANNFEILAGHEQVGQLQPVVIVQNLSNDIQGPDGINYQPQDVSFRVRCAIINQVTRRPLYNNYITIDSTAIALKQGEAAYEKVYLSKVEYKGDGQDYEPDTAHIDYYDALGKLKNWNGIPPFGYATIFFPPFEPNELFETHIGLMKAFAIIDPTDPRTGEGFRDMWPYDDTLNIRFWVMRHIPNDEPFVDDVTEYHVVPDDYDSPVAIPSVYKWVSIGATVVNGENVSHNPLPPRGEYFCENNEVYPTYKVSSPTIKMIRPNTVGIGEWGGNEIRSYPVDMSKKFGSVLTLAVQRTTKKDGWERGWSDDVIVGVEHRVVQSTWYTVIQEPDEIRVQFARPSLNWKDGTWISNISAANWTYHPRRAGAAAETKMSAYTLFGGGGYMVGFLESDRDSALALPVYTGTRAENGLRYDFYDDGIDYEYKKLFVPIPDTFIRAENEGSKYFRFRVQVYAKNNQLTPTTIADDDDDFYVDNVRILYGDVDIEIAKVGADLPFTIAPASQMIAIPIRMQLNNNTDQMAPTFWVKSMIVRKSDFDKLYFLRDTWVYRGNPNDANYEAKLAEFQIYNQLARDSARWQLMHKKPIYCRVKQISMLRPGANETVTMPKWNARMSPPGTYVVIGVIWIPGSDLEPLNDTTFSTITTRFGPVFAYHPVQNESNLRLVDSHVPEQAGQYGRGLNMYGYTMGGSGNSWNSIWEIGDDGGDGGSGQIASKFELMKEDTIYGIGGFYHEFGGQSPDHITYRLFSGDSLPENEIPLSRFHSFRGYDGVLDTSHIFGSIVFDLFDKPIVLPKGTYWASVEQVGEDGIFLGASKSRVAMRCTNLYYNNPENSEYNGSKAIYLLLDKALRKKNSNNNLVNDNLFAYKNGTNKWVAFSPETGNPGYAHLQHEGLSPVDNQTKTYTRGTWIPFVLPYMGTRSFNPTFLYEDCDIPVELTYFNGFIRSGAVDLIWETASEINNYGFYIERKVEDENWNTHSGLIQGYGTSNIQHEYSFEDKDVIPNTTYHYRLRQVDNDGTQSCDDFSNIVTLTYFEKGVISILPNSPNPFSDRTALTFILPTNDNVKLDILDLFGNVITTILDDNLNAGKHIYYWDGKDHSDKKCSSGTYIIRLRAGSEVLTRKAVLINN